MCGLYWKSCTWSSSDVIINPKSCNIALQHIQKLLKAYSKIMELEGMQENYSLLVMKRQIKKSVPQHHH